MWLQAQPQPILIWLGLNRTSIRSRFSADACLYHTLLNTTRISMMKAYLLDRVRKLKPTYDVVSPVSVLSELKVRQWLYLLLALFAWCWDAFDFISISTVAPQLIVYFGQTPHAITLGLTISLIPRFFGAAIFGFIADRYGRKWPFIVNCAMLSILELSLALCKTYTQFIICRALFGLTMGGIYGNATITALEDCPKAARGLVAGIFQSGYPMGFLLVTAFWSAFNTNREGDWKHFFYFAACPPLFLIIFRFYLPETEFFEHEIKPGNGSGSTFRYMLAVREAMKRHWKRILYLVVFMVGCSLMTHGSQDVFNLLLKSQYQYSSRSVTTTQITAHIGAIVGSWLFAFGGEVTGRRFSIIVACLFGAALIGPYCFVSGPGLYPVVFFEQFFIQGIFGIVPIHLMELSPPAFRTLVVGTSYNLGVLFASWVPMVETLIGEQRLDSNRKVVQPYRYNKVMAISLGVTFSYVLIVTFLGPENRDRGQGEVDDSEEMDEDRLSIHFMAPEEFK